jgi:hypothetical protein
MIPARRSAAAMSFFDRYVVRYLRRRFHRVLLWMTGMRSTRRAGARDLRQAMPPGGDCQATTWRARGRDELPPMDERSSRGTGSDRLGSRWIGIGGRRASFSGTRPASSVQGAVWIA